MVMSDTAAELPDGGPGSRWRKLIQHPVLAGVLMVLLSAIIIRSNYDKQFYSFDDETHFWIATEQSVSSLFFNFQTKYTYMPLSFLSLRADRILFGPALPAPDPSRPTPDINSAEVFENLKGVHANPEAYFGKVNWAPQVRIESAIYHALAAFLLWLFLRRLKLSPGLALFVACAWAAHPMACESVAWVSERKNVLMALFGFGALLAQTFREWKWRWALVSVLYLGSVLSKPTGVGILPVIMALEFLDPAAPKFDVRNARDWLRVALGFAGPVLITLMILRINLSVHGVYFVAPPGGTLFTALLTDLEIFSRYIINIVRPTDLSFFYGVEPILSLADKRVWIYGAGLIFACAALLMATRKELRPMTLFGLIWFFGALGPTANIAAIPYWMQDRYIYVSSAGFLLALGLAVQGIAIRLKFVMLTPVVGFAFVATLAFLTYVRSPLFDSSLLLAQDAAARQPNSGMAHFIYGAKLANEAFTNRSPEYLTSGQRLDDAKNAIRENSQAMKCSDIENFSSIYRLRVKSAQLMVFIGAYVDAREYLKDWLPPKAYVMAPSIKNYTAADMRTAYIPQTLAHAWLVEAEAGWRLAMQADRKTVPVLKRIELANEALAEIDKSIAVHVWEYQGYVLRARILIFCLFWMRKIKTWTQRRSMWKKPSSRSGTCPRRRHSALRLMHF